MKLEAADSSETSVTIRQSTRLSTTEDLTIHQHHCHNLKYFKSTAFCVRLFSQWLMLISCSVKHISSFIFCGHFWKWNYRFNGNSRCLNRHHHHQFLLRDAVDCQHNTAWWHVNERVCNNGIILKGGSQNTRKKTVREPLCSP